MFKNSSLLFGVRQSINFASASAFQQHLEKYVKHIVGFTTCSSSNDYFSNCTTHKVGNVIINQIFLSAYKTELNDKNKQVIDFILPISGAKKFYVDGNSIAGVDNRYIAMRSSSEIENVEHTDGLAIYFTLQWHSLNRIRSANLRMNHGLAGEIASAETKVFGRKNFKNDYYAILVNYLSIMESFDFDEEMIIRIGIDDVIQRTILNLLQEGLPETITTNNAKFYNRSDRSVDILCDKIRQFPGKVITLTEMQEITGLSNRSLQYAFNRRFGCTPREWQRNEHLNNARELLIDSNNNQSVKHISLICGFSSAASFSKFYLARFGVIPSKTQRRKEIGVRDSSALFSHFVVLIVKLQTGRN